MDQAISARNVARQVMEENEYNRTSALSAAIALSYDNPELMADIMRRGWEGLLSDVATSDRNSLEASTKKVPAGKDNTEAWKRAIGRGYLCRYTIPGAGVALKYATHDQLLASAHNRRANAKTENNRADFEEAIAKACVPFKPVGECLTEEQVGQIAVKFGVHL